MGSGNAMTTARPIAVFRSAATLKRPFPKPCSAVPLPCSCSVRRRAEAWALPMPSRETFDFMVELRQRRSEESPAAARRMDAALAGILREPAMKPELQRNAQDNTLRVWAAVSGAALENTKAERALLKRKGRVGGLEISAVGSLRLTNPTTGTFLREISPLNDGEWAVLEPRDGKLDAHLPENVKVVIRRATPGAWRWAGLCGAGFGGTLRAGGSGAARCPLPPAL